RASPPPAAGDRRGGGGGRGALGRAGRGRGDERRGVGGRRGHGGALMRRDAPVAHFSMGCADAGSGAPAGGRAPTECGGMGVLERIAEAREGLEPWRAATAAAELAAAPRDGAAACERMRTFL